MNTLVFVYPGAETREILKVQHCVAHDCSGSGRSVSRQWSENGLGMIDWLTVLRTTLDPSVFEYKLKY